MIEVCAGMLDGEDARTCALREAEEEAGVRLRDLREIAKSDPSLARAIESAERDSAAMGAPTRTVESAGEDSIRVSPQDEARLRLINAPREVHPIILRQLAEKQAAEQREKALEEQKSKIAERATAKGKDSDKGR